LLEIKQKLTKLL